MKQLKMLLMLVALALAMGCNRSAPPAADSGPPPAAAAGPAVPAALLSEAGGKAGFVEFSSPS